VSQKPKKWPDYALNSLEGTLYRLQEIDGLARQIQESAAKGDSSQVLILSSDIRTQVIDGKSLLYQARTGNYEHTASAS
jgi:hypothetical protein